MCPRVPGLFGRYRGKIRFQIPVHPSEKSIDRRVYMCVHKVFDNTRNSFVSSSRPHDARVPRGYAVLNYVRRPRGGGSPEIDLQTTCTYTCVRSNPVLGTRRAPTFRRRMNDVCADYETLFTRKTLILKGIFGRFFNTFKTLSNRYPNET